MLMECLSTVCDAGTALSQHPVFAGKWRMRCCCLIEITRSANNNLTQYNLTNIVSVVDTILKGLIGQIDLSTN